MLVDPIINQKSLSGDSDKKPQNDSTNNSASVVVVDNNTTGNGEVGGP